MKTALVILRSPGSNSYSRGKQITNPYEEVRRQNIARNEEMLRKLFEDNSPLCSPLPSPKRQKVEIQDLALTSPWHALIN